MVGKIELLTCALCVLVGVGASAQTSDSQKQDATPQNQTQAAGDNPASPSGPPPMPASMIRMIRLETNYGYMAPKDTEQYPPVSQSILGDDFGIRPALAKYKIGFSVMGVESVAYNLRDAPMSGMPYDPNGTRSQVYLDQRPTWYAPQNLFLTYNPEKNTQVAMSWGDNGSTWAQALGNTGPRLNSLVFTHMFFNKSGSGKQTDPPEGHRVKLTIGYVTNDNTYYLSAVGGNTGGGTLGANAFVPFMAGENHGGTPTPTINIKVNETKHFYTMNSFQRSTNPNGDDKQHDKMNFRFTQPGAKLLLIQEIGYYRDPAPGVKKTFVRADGWFNFSHYTDFREGTAALLGFPGSVAKKTDNNWAFSFAADRQIIQPDKFIPFRGMYAGFSVQYAPPQQDVYTQYYEFRIYDFGIFKSRPGDMLTLSVNYTGVSKIALHDFAGAAKYGVKVASAGLGYPTFDGLTNGVFNYSFVLRPGLYLNTGLQYTNHPIYAPKLPNPLGAVGTLALFF